jgi:excisionase family DNA binding protein
MPHAAKTSSLKPNERRAAAAASRERHDGRDMMTVAQAAAYLGLSKKSIYRLANEGELRSFALKNTKRFRPSDLDAYVERHAAT